MALSPLSLRLARSDRPQSAIAKAAGISQQHYALIESGGRPDPKLSTAVAIADALGVPLESLLERSFDRLAARTMAPAARTRAKDRAQELLATIPSAKKPREAGRGTLRAKPSGQAATSAGRRKP